jgi:hypothetical protein
VSCSQTAIGLAVRMMGRVDSRSYSVPCVPERSSAWFLHRWYFQGWCLSLLHVASFVSNLKELTCHQDQRHCKAQPLPKRRPARACWNSRVRIPSPAPALESESSRRGGPLWFRLVRQSRLPRSGYISPGCQKNDKRGHDLGLRD